MTRNQTWTWAGLIAVILGVVGYWTVWTMTAPSNPRDPGPQLGLQNEKYDGRLAQERTELAKIEEQLAKVLAASEPGSSSVASTQSEVEQESLWESFPRTETRFTTIAFYDRDRMEAKHLFRHVGLNKSDVELSRKAQASLSRLVRPFRGVVERLEKLLSTVRHKEATYYARAGGGAPIKPQPVETDSASRDEQIRKAKTPLEKRALAQPRHRIKMKTGDTLVPIDGRFVAVPTSALPFSRELSKKLIYIKQEQASAVANWFVSAGTLSPESRDLLMEGVWKMQ